MSINDHSIAVLNGLIETTLDSCEGYHEAAEAAKAHHFKSLFASRALKRRQLTQDLQAQVRVLGGQPEHDGTILGAAHRVFLNLKNAVAGSDKGVIKEVEAGEDHIKAKFEDAIEDAELPTAVKAFVLNAYASVKADHDQMRDLKRSMSS